MHPIMPDHNSSVVEMQYRMAEREREIAHIRLAQRNHPAAEHTPANQLEAPQVLRFRRLTAAIAAILTLR